MQSRKLLKTLTLAAGLSMFAAYGIACAYLWAHQEDLIFMPERTITTTPADRGLAYEEIFIPVTGDRSRPQRIQAWWIPSDSGNDCTVLYLHGSALNIGANVGQADRFHRLGLAVLLVSYRGYGDSDGDVPAESSLYEDARATWDHLVEVRGIDSEDILIYGHSLGGAVAVDLAVDRPGAGGLVLEATFTSIEAMARTDPLYRFFPVAFIVRHRFDTLSKIGRLSIPVLILHGSKDQLVPVDMAHTLYDRAPEPKRIVIIPGGGHNNSARVGGVHYLAAVESFLQLHFSDRCNPSAVSALQ
jgi:fermentation-respiration switch protein FrsA (DUF1100 family)